MATPKAAFIGLIGVFMDLDSSRRDDVLGPATRIRGRMATHPPLPSSIHPAMPVSVMLKIIRFIARGIVTQGGKPSPLFDTSGKPRVVPRVLSSAERQTAEQAEASA